MNKPVFVIPFFVVALVLFNPNPTGASSHLLWSTTYNCTDWDQSQGNPNCDTLALHGGWTCNGTATTNEAKGERITSAANNPAGGGGKGQRHWEGDGVNDNSGSLKVNFAAKQSEIWIRWYMRYEQGFKWDPTLVYDKLLYIDVLMPPVVIPGWGGFDKLFLNVEGTPYWSNSGTGWDTIMASGGASQYQVINGQGNPETHYVSDGKFHLFEIHIKMDTDGTDGVFEWWIDGTLRQTESNVNYGSSTGKTGWSHFLIGSNQRHPFNNRCMAVDYDDVAVSTGGYIGPVINNDTTPPTSPANPGVQ